MPLTLPLVPGKTYFRRDGEIISLLNLTQNFGPDWLEASDGKTYLRGSGRWSPSERESSVDLVADYIDPDKAHPHADKMAQFAEDAKETATPWDRWQFFHDEDGAWIDLEAVPHWEPEVQYRRKPTITPDPHAESMKLYAEDAAQTDRAWDRWECQSSFSFGWHALDCHPRWNDGVEYRRKASA